MRTTCPSDSCVWLIDVGGQFCRGAATDSSSTGDGDRRGGSACDVVARRSAAAVGVGAAHRVAAAGRDV